MSEKKKLAAIYGRKSRENATTLQGQINVCTDWCQRNGVDYELFVEEGSQSSEDWDRPKLQEMIKKIENLEYNLVVATEQTRICRDDMFPIFKNHLKETETLFVTADNNSIFDFANPDDELKSDILQAVGKNELSRTKIRLMRGTKQSAKKGNWQGKKAPAGYKYDPETKRLKKTEEADVVAKMFDLYVNEGLSTVEISHRFINENVLLHYKRKGEMVPITWSKSTISRMLNNIAYCGHTLFGKTKYKKVKGKGTKVPVQEDQQILVKNTHEPIISDETWERMKAIMERKRTQPPALKHAKHTFSGLIACANCGKKHSFEMGQNGFLRLSSCQSRHYNDELTEYKMCGNSGCDFRLIEKLFFTVLNDIREQLTNYIETIKDTKLSEQGGQKNKEMQKATKLQQIQFVKKKRKKIGQLIEEDFYEPKEEEEKKQEVKQLQMQINILEQEIEKLDQMQEESETQSVNRIISKMNSFLKGKPDDMSEKEANEILMDIVDKIIYRKKGRWAEIEMEIHWKNDIQEIIR